MAAKASANEPMLIQLKLTGGKIINIAIQTLLRLLLPLNEQV